MSEKNYYRALINGYIFYELYTILKKWRTKTSNKLYVCEKQM